MRSRPIRCIGRRCHSLPVVLLLVLCVLVATRLWLADVIESVLRPQLPDHDLSYLRRSRDLKYYLQNIQLLIEPSSTRCEGVEEVPLLVLVASSPSHLNRRGAIRNSWAKHFPTLFFLGVDGLDRDQALVDSYIEAKESGDMVVFDFLEHYDNLTLKTALMLHWSQKRCTTASAVLKTDDDVFVNPWVMKEVLKAHQNSQLIGYMLQDSKVHRDEYSKWYLPQWLFSEDYIREFLTGPGYVIQEFYFNKVFPKTPEELTSEGLDCYPGRTVIKIIEKEPELEKGDSEEDEDRRAYSRRSHMNSRLKEEYCKVCVCSDDGKAEYCSGRPAVNVNECLRMTLILKEFNESVPYDHTRGLPFRIRRDYIWHNDEIPYEPKAKCRRGHSFYTNNQNANDTDIDISSDIESLLDYTNRNICLYCVCAVHGHGVDCIDRDRWFCDYQRYMRERDTTRDMYTRLFQQDRPTYFREFPWRLRRTMDDGIYNFVETENLCAGCNNCFCAGSGEWVCNKVQQCPGEETLYSVDEESLEDALNKIEEDEEDFRTETNLETELTKILGRKKRSVENEHNNTIRFYHAVDELNEDILKNDNRSGTIEARKVANLPKASRRVGISNNESLLIEFSEPKVYDRNIVDNKIDNSVHSEDKYTKLEREKINGLIGNHSLKQRDKELSKLIVNELKEGSELIGDKNAPVMSNVTFTPENDTLTAMAFIAGNLLNQLWDIEKDSNEESKDIENLKHEKIADLLELFKEPLNIRQETFLKSALEHLSAAIDKEKVLKDVTLCEKINEAKQLIEDKDDSNLRNNKTKKSHQEKNQEVKKIKDTENDATYQAITKVGDVLHLIEKFQEVHKTLNDLVRSEKHDSQLISEVPRRKAESKVELSSDETVSLNVFGNILEKITKLLMPHKKTKKIVKAVKSHNLFTKSSDVTQTLKEKYGIDIGNSTLTAKDKIILDYLNTVKQKPNCIFQNPHDVTKSFSNVEGDILFNLSEFFKIKSFVDLLNLLEIEKKTVRINYDAAKPEVTTVLTKVPEVTSTTPHSTRFAKTKERLKDHIKSIIDDLRELQLVKGFPTNNITIADALPCIYNILNADNETQVKYTKNDYLSPVEKVSVIFSSLKKDLLAVPTRRANNIVTQTRPKSAIVWERIVKNYDGKHKKNTRRVIDNKKPKSFNDLMKMIKPLEQISNSYKSRILIKGAEPSKQQVLLKTLNEEVRKYIEVLENIQYALPSLKTLSVGKQNELKEFVYNAGLHINLNNRVVKSLNKFGVNKNIKGDVEIINPRKEKVLKNNLEKKQPARAFSTPESKKSLKLTRDEIINQLIKNRMHVYIRAKESKGIDLNNDVNYAIAKKILNYLEIGNYNLARELYKFIISQKEQARDVSTEYTTASSVNKYLYGFAKEPLLKFEEPTTESRRRNRNLWLKQLMNLKKM
ncbi:unnamed protein product [Diatraea saccharalis]|uniref:Uncharacterized protein n=1 Tax=Diatraea saccharalis TaxID=40085 RepID=A0A9N9WHM2_9NEOP|nr:unnamed protein product [Diatraea saccharalis]